MIPLPLHHDADDAAGQATDQPKQFTQSQEQSPQRQIRKSKSLSVVSSLVGAARDPVGAVGGFLGGFGQWAGTITEEEPVHALAKDVDTTVDTQDDLQKQVLYARLKEADSYAGWHAAATALDALEGNDAWKAESPDDATTASHRSYYNTTLIRHRLRELDDARINCDAKRMLFLIRTTLSRNLGGMNNIRLYRHSHVGTKRLIEQYIDSAVSTLHSLLDLTSPGAMGKNSLDPRVVLDQLLNARQAFGRSALLLSGGGTFGMNHIGVVKCLLEENYLPRIISGSSAGSIVCSVLATRTEEEIPSALDYLCNGDLAVFEDPVEKARDGLLGTMRRVLTHGAIFENKHLARVMHGLLGDMTFQEAYNRTRRILNICVSSASIYELPRLLNYITAPNVIIWSAVVVSCSVPLVFTPANLLAKDPKTGEHLPWNGPSPSEKVQHWIDGSVDGDLPMTRLSEMFNVNHFIVSQVNPHIIPFLKDEEGAAAEALTTDGSTGGMLSNWMSAATTLAKGELMHRMHILSDMHVLPTTLTKTRSILSQRYSGDITILPAIPYSHFPLVLTNPTPDFMMSAMQAGERATWPKISRIRNAVSIEFALDDAVKEARGRVVFSKSQVDLRLTAVNGLASSSSATRIKPRSRPRNDNWRHSNPVQLNSSDDEERDRKTLKRTSKKTNKPGFSKAIKNLKVPKLKGASQKAPEVDDDDMTESDDKRLNPRLALSSSPMSSSASSSTELEAPLYDDGDLELGGIRTSLPELWPSATNYFASKSQPTTPFSTSPRSKDSVLSATSSLTMTKTSPSPQSSTHSRKHSSHPRPLSSDSQRSMGSKQSEPERRYKHLFHPRPPTPGAVTPPFPALTPLSSGSATSHSTKIKEGLDSAFSMTPLTPAAAATASQAQLSRHEESFERRRKSITPEAPIPDVSGVRGMMLRRKSSKMNHQRSLSAGLKALKPSRTAQ